MVGVVTILKLLFSRNSNTHDSLENEVNDMNDQTPADPADSQDFDSFGSDVNADVHAEEVNEEVPDSAITSPNLPSEESDDLPKIIRDPNTGTTYYLDEANQRYYYVDPETNKSIYYNG